MSIIHFFITKKKENAILKQSDNTLLVVKKSNRPSKIYLSTINMKMAVIHNKHHVLDCVELNKINTAQYTMKSNKNNKFYTSAPVKQKDTTSPFKATADHQLAWEFFDLEKTKRIMLSDEVLSTLLKISE